ncbi:MAG: glycosyltransferase family 2 protein [Acidobacteria bacterium]|nr:glycosyltransferase family 2 protein [Acidobacteriota bacterium]
MTSISVLIPNFNGRRHLGACLESLQQQRRKIEEVVVFDNGSRDQSVEFISENFPSVRVIASADNCGFAGALNRAARCARGEWLAFMNNDMRAAPDWMEASLERSGTHECIASRILNWEGDKVDFDGSSLQYLGFADQLGIGENSARPSAAGPILFPCGGAMFIRRDLFLDVGGFDEDYFAIYEDVDLGWRLWLQGHEVFFDPACVVYHRGHATLDARREEKKRYLMHRNALFTMIKNLQQERFEKIVPVAFFQAIRRAVRFSGIDKTAFYFWEDTELPRDEASWWMCRDAVNHLVALDDVIENWFQLMEKRQQVQARRRRPDSEIASLFHDPFRRIFKDADYEACEAEWIESRGIQRLFPEAIPFAFTEGFATEMKRERQALRRELALLKSQLRAPAPGEKRGRMNRLARRLRQFGSH